MEKTLIENWYKRFSGKGKFDDWTLIKEEKTETTAFITYGIIGFLGKINSTVHYEWLGKLYQDAKETLEEGDWFIHSAYKIDNDYNLIIKNKNSDDFAYKANIFLEKDWDSKVRVDGVKIGKSGNAVMISKEEMKKKLKDNKGYKEKQQQIKNFLTTWMMTKSGERLKLLLENKKIKEVN